MGDDRPWAIVQHVAHEGPGLLGEALTDAAIGHQVVRVDLGEPLPRPEAIAGLVVLGGPMGVDDAALHPWLEPERALLAAAVERGLPVLGVCLGAQQLALALGAEVTSGTAPEIGIGRVELTADGRRIEEATGEWDLGVLAITHFRRLLDVLTPDVVYVLHDGRVVATGDRELAEMVDRSGYTAFA